MCKNKKKGWGIFLANILYCLSHFYSDELMKAIFKWQKGMPSFKGVILFFYFWKHIFSVYTTFDDNSFAFDDSITDSSSSSSRNNPIIERCPFVLVDANDPVFLFSFLLLFCFNRLENPLTGK